ncbi:hypothetical protein LTR70_010028 [Exophiala xenobiotica]|uniref:Uncharacterized protein n=1 Tax=Lithohypha guttulata TaxID=1690604 RepID=A0ABR0KGP8_9EURO|nr:hypothetical protein LTR24_002884 [Lithohypha guttulata]KAK5309738.1 hypothetical protein LTR70_010028 [Exophiala xenobiotica]
MAMKLVDGLDSSCVVLAYDDYECSSLVGSVPVSGKCVAATKAKIGSWQAQCNSTDGSHVAAAATSYASGELKRRGKYRLPAVRDEANMTNYTTDPIATASSIVSEISSAISESATATDAETTSSPSAGAAFSSAVSSGAEIGYSLTSYLTDTASPATTTGARNATGTPSMTTTGAATVVTYSGNTHANGSRHLPAGCSSNEPDREWQGLDDNSRKHARGSRSSCSAIRRGLSQYLIELVWLSRTTCEKVMFWSLVLKRNFPCLSRSP